MKNKITTKAKAWNIFVDVVTAALPIIIDNKDAIIKHAKKLKLK